MKKWLLALLLCLGIAGCSVPKDVQDDSNLDALHNAKSGVSISLGMSRDEVEKLLAEAPDFEWEQVPEESRIGGYAYYGETPEDAITVSYSNETGQVIGMWIDEERNSSPSSNWCLKDDVTKGGTKKEIIKAYGESTTTSENKNLITYYYDASGNQLGEDNSTAAYVIIFHLEKEVLHSFGILYTEDFVHPELPGLQS